MGNGKLLTQTGAVTEPNGNITVNGDGSFTSAGVITKTVQLDVDRLVRPAVNPPDVAVKDNTIMFAFTVDTDEVYANIPLPSDYAQVGGLIFAAFWTNDGGVDDNGKAVKVQISYQTTALGEAISGSHANSPKTTEDTYASASGYILHKTENMTIAHADISGKLCVHLKIMFITPGAAALTCEPRLIGICITYSAYQFILAT